jgi:lipopolysaccharide biosynthesis regulator YciM/uncharacterized membrane protein (UPF0136 family)
MLVWAKPMIADHPLFGIGRGAFESVFPAYRTTPGHVVFSHAENFPGQWLAEWGIPVTLAAAGALLWYFRPRRTRRTDVSLIAGAWTGVAVLLLQNLFDLGLEVASVCIALSLVLGAIWGNRERATAKITRKVVAPVRRRWQLAIVLTGVTVVTVAAFQGWHDLASDRQAAHVLVDDVRTPQTRLKLSSLLHAAMLRHPAEPYFPLVGAIAAHQAKENPVPWVERALERALLNPRAHFFLGEVLGATNHVPQALLELRIAVQQEPDLAAYAATAALRWTKELEYLLIAIPDGQSGASLLEQIAAQLADQDDPLRTTLLQQALHRSPRSSGVHLALAEVLLRELRRPESLTCAAEKRKTCEEEIERHATFVETALPNASPAARLRAMLLVERGDAERAEALLADRCRSMSDKIACARAWVQVAAHIKQPERLLVAAHELIAVACSGTSECAEALTWLGDLMGERREWGGALTYYARAVREQPTENRWLRVADASSHVGAYAEEAAALERVAQLRGQMDASLKTRIDESRARMILH